MGKTYTKQYELNYHDVDYKLRGTMITMMNFFADIGTRQSEELGVGLDLLQNENLTWVFYKYDIKVKKYPKFSDKVIVTTEAVAFKKFYAYRNYIIKNEQGEELVEAIALFFLIDINRRRPVRVPKEFYLAYGIDEDIQGQLEIEAIEKLSEVHSFSDFKVRYSDIDSNSHVNNVKYLEWAIETVPIDIVKTYELKRVKITFEKETTYGHTVVSNTQVIKASQDKIKCLHKIRDDEGKEITLLETHWSK